MFYIHIVDDDGKFEIIDGELLFLYSKIDADKLIEISDDDYQKYIKNQHLGARFIDGEFVFGKPVFDEQLQIQNQEYIWEAIKAKRHAVTRGGVYLKSVDKWFHSDDPSRTQYLTLQVLPNLPSDLMWKTMDNSFVPMTKELISELATTMLIKEQADFANAERHRLAMLQAEDPLSYDYSSGWSQTHE